jgi:hypothetical protein
MNKEGIKKKKEAISIINDLFFLKVHLLLIL